MILIADAGNTKTDWMYLDKAGALSKVRLGGISPYFDSAEQITEKVEAAARQFGSRFPEHVFYYGSGCSGEGMQSKILGVLQKVFPGCNHHVSDDLTGAAIALFGNRKGLVVISGTGSNAGLCEHGEITNRIRSLGYLLGDEGSGADIGFRFFRQLLSGNLPKELTSRFYEQYPSTPENLLSQLYANPKPQSWVAGFVPFLASNRDDTAVAGIVRSAYQQMVERMIIPLTENNLQVPVGCCGSVASLFEDELRQTLSTYGLEVKDVMGDPMPGMARYIREKYL